MMTTFPFSTGMNGFIFDNLKHLEMYLGETVEWYLIGIGEEVDIHTVHFHGQPVIYQQWTKHRVDVIELFPGRLFTQSLRLRSIIISIGYTPPIRCRK